MPRAHTALPNEGTRVALLRTARDDGAMRRVRTSGRFESPLIVAAMQDENKDVRAEALRLLRSLRQIPYDEKLEKR